MTVDDDTPDMDDEWQFGEVEPQPVAQGGGLLQTILSEVAALRVQADTDLASLSDALAGSFAKVAVELEVLREQVASLRAEVDASATQMTSAFTEMLKDLASDNDVDVPAVVERAVAAQGHANVEAVVNALSAQLAAVRNAVPTAETARIAIEISRLRHALIGPEHR